MAGAGLFARVTSNTWSSESSFPEFDQKCEYLGIYGNHYYGFRGCLPKAWVVAPTFYEEIFLLPIHFNFDKYGQYPFNKTF